MRTYLECVPCFARQAIDAARMVTDDVQVHEQALRQTLRMAAAMPFDRPPPWAGQQIHRMLRELSKNEDPYRGVKQRSNELALRLLDKLRGEVNASPNPFEAAVRLAIAGNIIDFGCKHDIRDEEVHESIEQAMHVEVDRAAIEQLRQAAGQAGSILYLADNAGEIVLDRLLIEQLPLERVTLVVKGSPIINDATREDARVAGLTEMVEVIDNGCDVPGTIIELCPRAFQERFARADLVIAKGQGNYETLSGIGREVFFLLKAKCAVIARHLGCPIGRMVVTRQNGAVTEKETME